MNGLTTENKSVIPAELIPVERPKQLSGLSDDNRNSLTTLFKDAVLLKIRNLSFSKASAIIKIIPQNCHLHYVSLQHKKARDTHPKKFHPIGVVRGDIYNAMIDENIGSELNGNHLVIIISNNSANIYAEKVNVIILEGNGN